MNNYKEYLPENFEYNGKWIKNWFSNMVESPIVINGKSYWSVENYYQASKTCNEQDHNMIAVATPSASKHLGRKIDIRADWEQIKENVMRIALIAKFTKPEWKEKLLATGDDMIIEWNNWGDKIWGVTINDCVGRNLLGYLLMEIRETLK